MNWKMANFITFDQIQTNEYCKILNLKELCEWKRLGCVTGIHQEVKRFIMLVLVFQEFWRGKINKYKIDNALHT
jgi:hypothetical protein